jgi:hypothetical protein
MIEQIYSSFIGGLLAILSAGILWLIRTSYEKHKGEILVLARFEKILELNRLILKETFEFIDQWHACIQNNRIFKVHFQKFSINDGEIHKLSSLTLINILLSLNYKLARTNFDIESIYNGYHIEINKINLVQDLNIRNNEMALYHEEFVKNLESLKENYEPLNNNLIVAKAYLNCVFSVRQHSLFAYMTVLFRDVFPRVTMKSVKKEVERLGGDPKITDSL